MKHAYQTTEQNEKPFMAPKAVQNVLPISDRFDNFGEFWHLRGKPAD